MCIRNPQLIYWNSFLLFVADVCVYNGKQYSQDQKWFNGCTKKCVCTDAKIGYYTCSDRLGSGQYSLGGGTGAKSDRKHTFFAKIIIEL